jgi:hypothetical protein
VRSVVELEELLAALPEAAAAAAKRIFAVSAVSGTLVPPPEMHPWITRLFGSVDAVRSQRIVRVTNLVTMEGSLFNELRSLRPQEVKSGEEVARTIAEAENDPFCHVETGTPADAFGRVTAEHATTASNVAKYDGLHGVLVFHHHDPLAPVDPETLLEHFRTARAWAERGAASDPNARYYFLMWNSLWRAGASIVHGHMQMTLTRGMHYPRVEALRRQAQGYRAAHGRDYFGDLWDVHEALGLGVELGGVRAIAYLTPVNEREVLLVGRPGDDETTLAPAVAGALAALRRLGVLAHNLAVWVPPLGEAGPDWSGFPPLARLVDRGDPGNRTSDMGAMELYAASVIASDPFRVADALRG